MAGGEGEGSAQHESFERGLTSVDEFVNDIVVGKFVDVLINDLVN